jgi:hypothetical protein
MRAEACSCPGYRRSVRVPGHSRLNSAASPPRHEKPPQPDPQLVADRWQFAWKFLEVAPITLFLTGNQIRAAPYEAVTRLAWMLRGPGSVEVRYPDRYSW